MVPAGLHRTCFCVGCDGGMGASFTCNLWLYELVPHIQVNVLHGRGGEEIHHHSLLPISILPDVLGNHCIFCEVGSK